jgi:hypothetical protein
MSQETESIYVELLASYDIKRASRTEEFHGAPVNVDETALELTAVEIVIAGEGITIPLASLSDRQKKAIIFELNG